MLRPIEEKSQDELLACPCCGGEANYWPFRDVEEQTWQIGCAKCRLHTPTCLTPQIALACWSRRTNLPADNSIPVREIKPGQTGRITQWGIAQELVGTYIFCGGSYTMEDQYPYLVSLTGYGFWNSTPTEDHFRVVIVPDGTLFASQDNE